MKEIRIHGRGGQGAVIASWILAYGFFLEGKHAQAFPTFGAERRGAPVEAFVRVDDSFVNLRCKVRKPDYVVVMNEQLARNPNVFLGIQKGGMAVINSSKHPLTFGSPEGEVFDIKTLDVDSIALKYGLGSKTSPFVNTPILGALLGFSRLLKPDSVIPGIKKFLPARTQSNIDSFKEAYQLAREKETREGKFYTVSCD
jgi:2-oxoacid:acceptor oxidoreductase gamma subunit (pyruvate/2-ketoisovalerate family)